MIIRYRHIILIVFLITVIGCSRSSDEARQLLKDKGLSYSYEYYIESIDEGDIELVRLFLDAGMDPETLHPTGYTVLTYAAKEGYLKIAKLLIKRGASVDNMGKRDELPLSVIIASGEFDSFTLFIRHKAAQKLQGESPPISAAIKADIEYDKKQYIVKYLVKYGADVNATDNGQTCLSVAKEYGEKEIEDYLISVGAHY